LHEEGTGGPEKGKEGGAVKRQVQLDETPGMDVGNSLVNCKSRSAEKNLKVFTLWAPERRLGIKRGGEFVMGPEEKNDLARKSDPNGFKTGGRHGRCRGNREGRGTSLKRWFVRRGRQMATRDLLSDKEEGGKMR